jgi:epoxyqueuosine reductase
MDKKAARQELEDLVRGWGFDLFGVADVTTLRETFALPPETRAKFDRAISLGKKLNDAVMDDIPDHPTQLYFHHYRQMNYFLDRGALRLADRIERLGFSSLPIAASQLIDWERQSAHLSHKHVAVQAGLGWLGRNNLLVNPGLGSRLRLVTVLTDMPLEADTPMEADCGTCRACLASCPSGSIKERREDFDHLACFRMLKDFRKQGLVSQFICGVCVKACRGPKGKAAGVRGRA